MLFSPNSAPSWFTPKYWNFVNAPGQAVFVPPVGGFVVVVVGGWLVVVVGFAGPPGWPVHKGVKTDTCTEKLEANIGNTLGEQISDFPELTEITLTVVNKNTL